MLARFGRWLLRAFLTVAAILTLLVVVGVGLSYYANHTPSTSTPEVAPVPVGAPPPTTPPVTPGDNRGWAARWGEGVLDAFKGQCSVRSRVINLGSDWVPINIGVEECLVVYEYRQGSELRGREHSDSAGFSLTSGLLAGRSIREVRWASGEHYFKYSLCPMRLNGQRLTWDCTPFPQTAKR